MTGAGPRADYDDFYLAVAPRLRSQPYLLTGDREEARDCVQDALERAWLRWDQVSQHDSPEAWVRTVARRLAVSRWRRVRNAAAAWSRRADPGVDEGGQAGSTTRVAVVAALQRLPVEQRTAIVLHHLCDLDVAAVAAETASTVSAVKSRLARGRARLAELLDDPRVEPAEPLERSTR
jgi:RNA polymerase sigma-70 factor (ECF subfamily)